MKSSKRTALFLGILSALFFAITFVLNRFMAVQGGHWIWSASIRYFWTALFLLVLVLISKKLKPVVLAIKEKPSQWLFWSTIGFGMFYAPLTFASAFGPSWLIAGTWQITILAGIIVAPWIQKTHPKKALPLQTILYSLIILLGVLLMQVGHARQVSIKDLILGFAPVLVAAFAYPIGNRKMMEITIGKIDALQRTFGMTVASLPFWILLSCIGLAFEKFPTASQVNTTLWVAICSGVVATVLFFKATDKVQKDPKALAAVEATQSTEVLFALVGELLILNETIPDRYAIAGGFLVLLGMVLHSLKK
ncbi:multidrug resistance efflux transporter family protein [Algoriphagus sp. Y33]|uniref:DMT family transporter n=1 Tax=Algoriphagus sp. Y33 TaxID=2772483 RepID=UPI00177F1BF5|nr:multidrug resistance efflux transporter family protein [Algoriphagus sp. Y33]